jgi:aspartyl aminopeptidase
VKGTDPAAGWKIATAHTDSPGWKLKWPSSKLHPSGVTRIGTEVYGSPIHSSWFDRPLAIAGRVFAREAQGLREVLVRTEPLGVFPNLAIHYNREVNKGLAYDLGEHLCFLAAFGAEGGPAALARLGQFPLEQWVSADLWAVEPTGPVALGDEGLFTAPRIDNLAGCHAVIEGLLSSAPSTGTKLVVCFDHEEIGSTTSTGADSSLLSEWMTRIQQTGGSSEDLYRARAGSFLVSVDAAHGAHPNWPSQHDEAYSPQLGRGPVLKSSARQSYATTAATEARLRETARRAQVPLQDYVMKSTLTPGSTVGPLTSSWAGIPGVDVGIPIWAMHSARETADLKDQKAMVVLLREVLGS